MTDDWRLKKVIITKACMGKTDDGRDFGLCIDEDNENGQYYRVTDIDTLRQKLIEGIKEHVEYMKKSGLGSSSYYSGCYAIIPIIDKRFEVID